VFAEYSGMAIKARMATIVTTIINSTNVNASFRRILRTSFVIFRPPQMSQAEARHFRAARYWPL
jgi:hypothetical protein